MHRRFDYLIAGLTSLAIMLSGGLPASAKDQKQVFMAPGFQFDQVDILCVMPVADERQNARIDNPDGGLEKLRQAVMWRVLEKGYHLADPNCSRDVGSSAAEQPKTRWALKVSLQSIVISRRFQSLLYASLVDAQSAKEVWRAGPTTGIFGDLTLGTWDLFSKFEKKKNPPPLSQPNMWTPMSLSVLLAKGHSFSPECSGSLRLQSGILSFEQSFNGNNQDKCASFLFSMQGALVNTNQLVWMMSVPGKGNLVLQQPDETQAGYLFLAVQNLR